jgi:hypothetical protein
MVANCGYLGVLGEEPGGLASPCAFPAPFENSGEEHDDRASVEIDGRPRERRRLDGLHFDAYTDVRLKLVSCCSTNSFDAMNLNTSTPKYRRSR